MQRVHYDIVVKGRVQRVRYRQSALEAAGGLGIDGFALNLPDGSVRIQAEGPREALDRLVTWCRTGPPAARVEEVVVKEGPLQHHPPFHVRH